MVLNPGRGTQVKGIDIDLPTWLKAIVAKVENPDPYLVTAMIQNQDDGNNSIFNFPSESEQANKFRST